MSESRIEITITYEFLLDMMQKVVPSVLKGPGDAPAATSARIRAASCDDDEGVIYISVAAEHEEMARG